MTKIKLSQEELNNFFVWNIEFYNYPFNLNRNLINGIPSFLTYSEFINEITTKDLVNLFENEKDKSLINILAGHFVFIKNRFPNNENFNKNYRFLINENSPFYLRYLDSLNLNQKWNNILLDALNDQDVINQTLVISSIENLYVDEYINIMSMIKKGHKLDVRKVLENE